VITIFDWNHKQWAAALDYYRRWHPDCEPMDWPRWVLILSPGSQYDRALCEYMLDIKMHWQSRRPDQPCEIQIEIAR